MAIPTIVESYEPPMTTAYLDDFEHQSGVKLPPEYRDFLLLHNGGAPEPDAFPISDNPSDSHALVAWFLGQDVEDDVDLLTFYQETRGRMPDHLIPIATDPGGNLICLSVTGETIGTVYFWEHEEEAEEGEPPTEENLYFVASSFSEFLASFTDLSDTEEEEETDLLDEESDSE